jgi:superfamily II DNA or RNA helicase
VTSIDYVKRPEVLRALETLVWDVVVVDEAHGVSGRSDRRAAAEVLGARARTLVMLTATPHSGDDEAFRRLCGIGDLGDGFPIAVFRRTRVDAGFPSSRRTAWLTVAPSGAEAEMHRALMEYARLVWRENRDSSPAARLAILVLLRRAASSAGSLARSLERRLQLLARPADDGACQPGLPFGGEPEDDEPGTELAAPGLRQWDVEQSILRTILRLACDARGRESKMRAVRRLLRRSGERAIVFTEYRDTLASLSRQLAEFDCAELHGGLPAAERRRTVEQFAAGDRRVLLATDAASEGLNLHEGCRLVINLELPWTPVRLEQRVGRVDRIGQRHRVHQVLLVAAGTVEQSTVAAVVRERAAHVGRTLEAMRVRNVGEHEIAERVFNSASPSRVVSAADSLPVGVVALHLRDAAMADARRAHRARALGCPPHTDPGRRPFAAATHRQARRGCWAFRVGVITADGDCLCETILGACYTVHGPVPGAAAGLRRHLDRSREALSPLLRPWQQALLDRVASAVSPSTSLATARETAIVDELRRQQGRLAAALLQPALFDRRVERDRSEQNTVFDETVARCHEHLARLSHRGSLASAPAEPAFALIRR